MSEAPEPQRRSSSTSIPVIIAAVTGLITAIGAVVGVLLAAGILPTGGSPTPTSVPSAAKILPTSGAGQPAAAFHELQIRADPLDAGRFVLNPNPNAQGRYSEGTRVTIDVLPKEGWRVETWVGPVEDETGLSAKIDMDSGRTVVVVFTENARIAETPTLVPFNQPAITNPVRSRTGVSGEWIDVVGNTVTFKGTSGFYEFTQRDAFGNLMAEGTATFSDGLLVLVGVNVLGLSFLGLLEVTGESLKGVITNDFGVETIIELSRN